MSKIIGMILLSIGLTTAAMAAPVPEIDPGTGINAVALLSGVLILTRSRRQK